MRGRTDNDWVFCHEMRPFKIARYSTIFQVWQDYRDLASRKAMFRVNRGVITGQ